MSDRCFVYADPPYLWETRRSQRDVYRHEFGTLEEHERLLDVLETLACPVMLSGYRSELYDRRLASWRRIDFQAMTRGGAAATESIWMNYPEPEILHDYRYLGEDFRQRERITRKARRWQDGLRRMPRAERQAVLSALIEDTVDRASPDVAILEDRIGS